VEFALVVPILVTLLLGLVTTGIAYSNALGLTNAVREGSRFGAITPYPVPAGNWADDVIARTRATQFDDPDGTSRICVALIKQPTGLVFAQKCVGDAALGTPSAFTVPSGTATGGCAVRVWAARSYSINALFINSTRTMSRASIAVYERSPCGT
jgi:Flp pilus assembly protein TadG